MILLLDTNVISELMKPAPEQAVLDWFLRRGTDTLSTSAVCQAEIFAGIAILPDGNRRRALEASARSVFARVFGDRVLPFDSGAALTFGDVVARRRRIGHPIKAPDAMIAAIARVHGAGIVTRDITDFEECGVVLHDP